MIVVWGSVNADLIFPLPRLPAPGETVLGPGAHFEPGGKGANQAVAAARDGATVVMAGAVGRDALADGALAGLAAAGVDLTRVARLDAPTGCAAICTDPHGRNQIAVGAGANLLARADQVEDALLQPGATLLLQMECDPAETAALIHRARARGARVVLSLAPAAPLEDAALRAVDLLLLNEAEAAWLGGHYNVRPARLHVALGVPVILTLGADGAAFTGPSGSGVVAAPAVEVVDTTAAGDCLAGVLAAGLDRGMEVGDALRRAVSAASLCCTRPGSQRSLPDQAETEAFVAGTAAPSPIRGRRLG